MSAETAILLSGVLGTEPDFWMALQAQYDLWHAQKALDEARKARPKGKATKTVPSQT
jgi:plasmid maintenance system antidote protein VapI